MKSDMTMRCVLNKDNLPVTGAKQAVYALVDIRSGFGGGMGTLPVNFNLVLDRSGSMDGEKMENLKEAVGYIIDHLSDDDKVSVTIFDDQVETLIPNMTMNDREGTKAKVSKITARGGTQISDGLKAGIAEAKKGHSPERVSRILLLTDGHTWDDEAACRKLSEEAAAGNITITTIGIGDEWNERLLLDIAEKAHGDSHWIKNPIEILDIFRQEVEGVQSVAAVNVKLTVRLNKDVKPVRVYSTVPMIADISKKAIVGSGISADLGQLDGRRGQAVLIEMSVPGRQTGRYRIGQAEVVYDMPTAGLKRQSLKADIFADFTTDQQACSKVNAEVMNLVEKVSAFKLQTRALSDAEAGDIAAATQRLQAAATILLNLGEDGLAEAAEKEILTLKKTGTLSSAGTKKLEYGTRKLTKAIAETVK